VRSPTFSAAACTSADEDDRALVARFRQGDREAFAELVVRYQGPVYNAAFWVVRRAEDASDICQTAFLKAAERIDDYDPRFKFFSWLYRITLNEALNLVRDRGREEELDETIDLPAPGADGPEERLQAAQRSGRVQQALMKLSTRDRVVVSLRHFSELSYAEIAEVLDLDEKTVKSRLFEARQRLRILLGDSEGTSHALH
jgi:RNA polymerase sigma-70 factor (ECF subfamily)